MKYEYKLPTTAGKRRRSKRYRRTPASTLTNRAGSLTGSAYFHRSFFSCDRSFSIFRIAHSVSLCDLGRKLQLGKPSTLWLLQRELRIIAEGEPISLQHFSETPYLRYSENRRFSTANAPEQPRTRGATLTNSPL